MTNAVLFNSNPTIISNRPTRISVCTVLTGIFVAAIAFLTKATPLKPLLMCQTSFPPFSASQRIAQGGNPPFLSLLYWDNNIDEVRNLMRNFPDRYDRNDHEYGLGLLASHGDLESISYLLENGLVDGEDKTLSRVLSYAAKEGQDHVVRYLLPKCSQKSIQQAIQCAATANQHETIRVIRRHAPTPIDPEDAFLGAIKMGHFSTVRYFLQEDTLSQECIDQGIVYAAEKGYGPIIRLLIQKNGNRDLALKIAAERNHTPLVKYLIKQGANPFASPSAFKDVMRMGLLKKGIESLTTDQKYMALFCYLDDENPPFQLIQDHFTEFSSDQQFALLEKILAYHSVDDQFCERIISLPSEKQFLLLRLALLAEKECYPKMVAKANLTEEQQKELQRVECKMGNRIRERVQEKEKILQANQNIDNQVQNLSQWQEEVQKKVQENHHLVFDLIQRRELPNAHYYDTLGGRIVAELDEFPGYIFKRVPKLEKRIAKTAPAMEVCRRDKLNRIRIPKAILLTVNDWPIIVEEKLDLVGHKFYAFNQRLQLMNRDPELQPIIDAIVRQYTIFVYRRRVCDLKTTNTPFLADGTGIAFVDLSCRTKRNTHPFAPFYTYQKENGRSSISYIEERNMDVMRNTLIELDYDTAKNYDFAAQENPQREYLKMKRYQKQSLLKRGIVEINDPIVLETQHVKDLTPLDQEVAKELVATLNHEIKSKLNREVLFQHLPVDRLEHLYTLIREEDPHFVVQRSLQRVIRHLQEKEILFHTRDLGGHGIVIHC